jgi:hypothetical protein
MVFCFSVQISQPCKGDGLMKILYILVKIVFELNLVSKHCSEFQMFIKMCLFFKLHHFPLHMKFYIPNMHIYMFQYSISFTTLLLFGTCPLNIVALDFHGDVFISNCFVVQTICYCPHFIFLV